MLDHKKSMLEEDMKKFQTVTEEPVNDDYGASLNSRAEELPGTLNSQSQALYERSVEPKIVPTNTALPPQSDRPPEESERLSIPNHQLEEMTFQEEQQVEAPEPKSPPRVYENRSIQYSEQVQTQKSKVESVAPYENMVHVIDQASAAVQTSLPSEK